MRLGVNIDHIATLREARHINEPNPLFALPYLQAARVNQVTIHLREDRRHICDDDVKAIIKHSSMPVNVEAAMDEVLLDFLCDLQPYSITLVPEKREEITTEGGLDLDNKADTIKQAISKIQHAHIHACLFIDPTIKNINLSHSFKADKVELHTGQYANLWLMAYSNLSHTKHSIKSLEQPRTKLIDALSHCVENIKSVAQHAKQCGLDVAAGHGLNVQNVRPIADIDAISELNIGHSIIGRSVFIGLKAAIEEIWAEINHQ